MLHSAESPRTHSRETSRDHSKARGLNIRIQPSPAASPASPSPLSAGFEEWPSPSDDQCAQTPVDIIQNKLSVLARIENERLRQKFYLQNFHGHLRSDSEDSHLEMRRRSVLSDDSSVTCFDDSYDDLIEARKPTGRPLSTGDLADVIARSASPRQYAHRRNHSIAIAPMPMPINEPVVDEPNLRYAWRNVRASVSMLIEEVERAAGRAGCDDMLWVVAAALVVALAGLAYFR